MAQLVADLSVGGATCSLTVCRGAGGAVAWRGEVRPAEDAAARLLLYRLACGGRLQQEGQRPAMLPVGEFSLHFKLLLITIPSQVRT